MFKKIAAFTTCLVVAAASLSGISVKTSADDSYDPTKVDYGKALQEDFFFYEVQQSGILPSWNQVSWRDDCMEDDIVPGGWFDAGDHFKFSLTNAYTAMTLGWGYIQYQNNVKAAGLDETYRNNLQYGLEFVKGCYEKASDGKVIGTIGKDGFDHTWWGSPELYQRKLALQSGDGTRPYDETTCTSTVADMASALALGYVIFDDESYLKDAKELFELADRTRSNEDQGVQKSYYPCSDYYDELFFAANCLYMATKDDSYLSKAESDYIPNLATESQSTERKYTWGYCWDDTLQGAALLYAINTGKDEWKTQIEHHLEYWINGYGGKKVDYTDDGMAYLMQWGACRHDANTCFLAYVAADTIFKDDPAKVKEYKDWAKEQTDYMFGKNKLNLSYVRGFGTNPKSYHHRGGSGIYNDHWNDLGKENTTEGWQTEYCHEIYGALEGGPNKDGTFTDEVSAYQNTEVAIDYNAGFTGLLAGLIGDYGGSADSSFPPIETPTRPEFEMAACINQSASSYTEVKVWAMNHSAWPARVIKNLSYNYYFDITELVNAGHSISDVSVKIGYDQHASDEGKLTISDPIQYKGNIYYVKLSFADGSVVMPTGQSEHRSEAQFRISVPDTFKDSWDATNDWSFDGLGKDSSNMEKNVTDHITMYDGDTLIWGTEPDGTTVADDYYPVLPARFGGKDKPIVTTTTKANVTTTTTTTTTTVTSAKTTTASNSTTAFTSTFVSKTTSTKDNTTTTNTTTDSSDPTETQVTVPDGNVTLWGDANVDGDVNISDAVVLNRMLASSLKLTDQGMINSNLYQAGGSAKAIDSMDSEYLMKFLVSNISTADLPIRG